MIDSPLRQLARLYGFGFPRTAVIAYRTHDSSVTGFLKWFYSSKTYKVKGKLWRNDIALVMLLAAAMVASVVTGLWLLIEWARFGTSGMLSLGVAFLLAYPFVVAHVLALGAVLRRLVYYLLHPKALGRAIVCTVLERQVKTLRRKHKFTVVAVAGSVGKTSTKLAIADLLGQSLRVRHQAGNYNDRVTVPLVFFDQTQPSLLNPFAWARLIGETTALIQHPYPYDVVVVELGTDGPGQLKAFEYIKPDVTVLTAISPEHMEYFGTLDRVAEEELSIFDYSRNVLVNGDDIPGKYLVGKKFQEYSLVTNVAHNYYAKSVSQTLQGQKLQLEFPTGKLKATTKYVGEQGAKIVLAAVAVADMLGISHGDIMNGLARVEAFAGRMQVLEGIKQSTLIDDTYNATPIAVKAALDVLYKAKAPQHIAVLGSMNELGDFAREAHHEVGEYCDPRKLDLVVTVGSDAKRWIAPIARGNGCVVHSFASPYDAGDFVRKHLQPGAVVLAKGSQNRVYTEEVIKKLLAHPADSKKLVRQSKSWLRLKAKQFSDSATF